MRLALPLFRRPTPLSPSHPAPGATVGRPSCTALSRKHLALGTTRRRPRLTITGSGRIKQLKTSAAPGAWRTNRRAYCRQEVKKDASGTSECTNGSQLDGVGGFNPFHRPTQFWTLCPNADPHNPPFGGCGSHSPFSAGRPPYLRPIQRPAPLLAGHPGLPRFECILLSAPVGSRTEVLDGEDGEQCPSGPRTLPTHNGSSPTHHRIRRADPRTSPTHTNTPDGNRRTDRVVDKK